jgi:hypothetical protein
LQCPKCLIENPQDHFFCLECGGKLKPPCPDCGAVVIPEAKFCGKCGSKLASRTTARKSDPPQDLSQLQRYLPEGLAQKILSQKDRIQGEMRQVTVMFCDMEGFTTISEKIGPEGVYGQADNPNDKKFCSQCGAKLLSECRRRSWGLR